MKAGNNNLRAAKTTDLILRYKYIIIFIVLLIIIAAGSGMRFLEFSSNDRVFFRPDDPQLIALEALENIYTRDNNVQFAIAPKEGDIFKRETLAAIEELTQDLWETPYSSRVDSITNFQHTRAEEDDLIVENLVRDAMSLTDGEIREIKKIALNEPFLVNYIVSQKGDVTSVTVTTMMPEKSPYEVQEVTAFARAKAAEFKSKHPELDLYMTGGVLFSNAFAEASQDDMSTLVPLMFVIMVIIIFFSLRSLSGTFSTVLIIVSSVVTAMGIAGWLGISITSASAVAPTIILTLAIADSIHILSIVIFHMRRGMSKNDSIIESMRINMEPVFLTSFTTAIGFLSMNSSDAPPFHDLGNIVAVGVIAAYLFSVTLLPALISILPLNVTPAEEGRATCMDRCGGFVVRHRKALLWGMAGLLLVLAYGITRIELNDNLLKYFDNRYQFRRDADFIEENLIGMDVIEYSLNSGGEGGISDPEYLATLEDFAIWFRGQPNVSHVATITDIMKRLNKNMHGDDPAYFRLPEERDLAAQYLMLYEMSLPFGMDMNNQINIDKSSSRFTVWLKNLSSNELRALEVKGREWLQKNAPPHMYAHGTGLSILFANLTRKNIDSMLGGTLIALVLISGTLIFAFRNIKIGLVSLLPNLIPAMMAFGLWGLIVGRVNLGVSVVAAMSLGLVVDDTIHFLSKYLYAKRELGKTSAESVEYTFHTVGRALFSTSVILAGGFLVLTLSGFKMNAYMGLLTAIAIGFALIADFFFLPPLLLKLDSEKNGISEKYIEREAVLDQ